MGIIFIDTFPLSNKEKLFIIVDSLRTYQLTIEKYPNKMNCYRILFPEYSIPMCKAIITIIKNKIKVYRAILFPNEFRKLWSYCPTCKTKRFYSRMPDNNPFDPEKSLNKIFKCNSCHYLEFEHILDKKTKEPQRYSMPMPKGFMNELSAWADVYEKIDYYKEMNISFEDFFIKLNKKLLCPVCNKVFTKRTAKQHYNAILNKKTQPSCRKYVKF